MTLIKTYNKWKRSFLISKGASFPITAFTTSQNQFMAEMNQLLLKNPLILSLPIIGSRV